MPYVAPIITAVAAVAGAGVATYSAVDQAKRGKQGLRDQRQAQQQASANALGASKAAAEANKKASARRPDILALLAANAGPKRSATNLTGGLGTTKLGL